MHVLRVEVWIILKVIVLRTKVLRMGNQAVLQEFVPGAERATTGLGCTSLSQVFWAAWCRETRETRGTRETKEGTIPRPRLTQGKQCMGL
jgi:hypothetical protein